MKKIYDISCTLLFNLLYDDVIKQEEAINMNPHLTITIDKLIQYLQEEKQFGATTVTLSGRATLYTDHGNSVMMTTEPQI